MYAQTLHPLSEASQWWTALEVGGGKLRVPTRPCSSSQWEPGHGGASAGDPIDHHGAYDKGSLFAVSNRSSDERQISALVMAPYTDAQK
ncbi:hypothetical protein MKZ38_007795 [Zalerion maritima]|uniref:Uncharacterized protein n=1 Tax=Zalerion maritima TaxID=339359 RepID=A0AAD5RHD4_9PEZI|nr:hypothetical protein MKZ38_007795 [Zalerion maritima]